MMSTAMERCPFSSIHMVGEHSQGGDVTELEQSQQPFFVYPFLPDNGYYFPYSNIYREKRDTSVSLIKRNEAGGRSGRRKDPVLLLPWWKEIIGTIFFCIAATTYIVRKFFHPPAPVAYVRVRACTRVFYGSIFWVGLRWVSFCPTRARLVSDVFCRPLKQRKESETQCQTDCKFDLEVVESKDAVAMDTRSSDYVSR